MKKLRGFTLAETLVTLGIIGVVASVVLPMFVRVRPNEEMIMLRKAYYLASRTINELINDEDFYPDTEDENTSGFSNTNPDPPARYHGVVYEGNEKFCGLFAARMNLRGQPDCNTTATFTNGAAPVGNFTTTDGMVWGLPTGNAGNFARGTAPAGDGTNIAQTITVDVNGDKRPNCFPGNGCRNPDRYRIRVDRWGKIFVDEPTRRMLTATDMTRSYDELRN